MPRNTETILTHYLVAALWSSTDEFDEPMDSVYTIDDIAPEAVAKARADVEDFVTAAGSALDNINDEQIGHDFWLTRNGHGAGFWDRGLGAVGDYLTDLCKPYGGVDLYVGDDGYIHST